ncbi:MAG: hypothetical protein M3A44_06935 [Gammaproteobacteria bacterium]
MNEEDLYDLLTRCNPSQLDYITVKLQLNDAFLPGSGESVATRASAMLKLIKPRGVRGFTALEKTLTAALGLKPAPKTKQKRDTDKVSKPAKSHLQTVLSAKPNAVPPSSAERTMDPWLVPGGHTTQLRTIRIFLASSEELRQERDEFELYFRQQNDQFRKRGFYLEINRWENFLDAMSGTRSQDEYNKAVRDCDVFVSLFFTKTGKFTEEEFDTAHRQFKETGRPLIYTFFKNAEIKTGSTREEDMQSLWVFQKKLATLGHFFTRYDNVEHLKRQFRDQLDKLLA